MRIYILKPRRIMEKRAKKANEKIRLDGIKRLRSYIDRTQKAVDYSLERFDILIISLSTTALILSVGFVKDLIPNFDGTKSILLKLSWLFFVATLLSNLLSQVTGYYANKISIRIAQHRIKIKTYKPSILNEKKLIRTKSIHNYLTYLLNGLSLFLFIVGVIVLIIYLSNNI